LNEELLGRTLWRTGFGRGCGPVVRHTTDNETFHEIQLKVWAEIHVGVQVNCRFTFVGL
jgi:hypothetical protein